MCAAFVAAEANFASKRFCFLVIGSKLEQTIKGRGCGSLIAKSALHDGQVHACAQLRWVVGKYGSPKPGGDGVLVIDGLQQGQVADSER